MKVYVVVAGEYESQGVSAVFSSREKAEDYINYFIKTGGYPESWFYIVDHFIDRYTKKKVLL